jgi:hypothetical protein
LVIKEKNVKNRSVKKPKTSKKTKKAKAKKNNDNVIDSGIIIVDDEFDIDKDIVNEERRAYLEEARSQDASE